MAGCVVSGARIMMTSAQAAASLIGAHREPGGDGFFARLAVRVQPDANRAAAVAQIQRVRVPLRTVADDGDLLGLDQRQVRGSSW